VYTARGTITVKCRVTSSVSIVKLKPLLIDKLRKHHYYLRPSLLRAVRTGKAGWFYLAHPDLTHRAEFTRVLPPFVTAKFQREIEFQVSPELENIETNGKKTSQRVLVVRCSHEEVENIRSLFTELFSAQSTSNIGFLARYTFVPTHPIGPCTKQHLSTLLQMQQHFHKSVYWFNLIGVKNIDSVQQRKQENQNPSSLQSSSQISSHSTSSTPSPQDSPSSSMEDTPMEQVYKEDSEDISSTCDPVDSSQPSSPEPSSDVPATAPNTSTPVFSSLRLILYHLENKHGQNLIHAVYPSADTTKVYVLCSEKNREEVLYQIQHVFEIVQQNFVPSAMQEYFTTPNGNKPYVLNYPLLSDDGLKYVDSLVDITASGNPQDAPPLFPSSSSSYKPSFASVVSPSPNKRQRGNEAKATTNLPVGFATMHDNDDTITSSLQETTSRLHTLEATNKDTVLSLEHMSKRLDQQGAEINSLGQSLVNTNKKVDKVSETQITHGNTMCHMNNSLTSILQELEKLTKINPSAQLKNAEPSYGDEVTRK